MRINLNMEAYDIKSLDGIVDTVRWMMGQCDMLNDCGVFLKDRVVQVGSEFDSVNYDRICAATDDYLVKLGKMRAELDELLRSCREFVEKINRIWA